MKTLPVGAVIMLVVILFLMSEAKAAVFVNAHSFAIVVVGTLAVLALCTPSSELKMLWGCILSMFKSRSKMSDIEKSLLLLSRKKDSSLDISHPLTRYAQHLWALSVEEDMFTLRLNQKMEEENSKYESSVAILRNLAKYPPALGMTGTVVGLVTVFSSLGGEDRGNVGPALGVALTATFYGLLLANAIIMPISDRLLVTHLNEVRDNDYIFQRLIMINKGEPIESFESVSHG